MGGSAAPRLERGNAQFHKYYKEQLAPLLHGEDDWDALIASLGTPLPVSFRISGAALDATTAAVRLHVETVHVPALAHTSSPLRPLPWYPARLAWQVGTSRSGLRGRAAPGHTAADHEMMQALRELRSFLMEEADAGHVHRQEAASMVPPLLLDVKPGMRVLDMCASPGSKSQQLLELLRASGSDFCVGDGACRTSAGGALSPHRASLGDNGGILVANDADFQRSTMLASRACKLNSTELLVCCHDGRHLPEAFPASHTPVTPSIGHVGFEGRKEYLFQFDRILCDVPCSGDGTIRKAPNLWPRWVAANGNALHRLQLQLAAKAVRLLRVGGRLVYSTCSLNPIENEAVVAALLKTFGKDVLRVVDTSTALPGLATRCGLTHWRIWHRGKWHESFASLVDRFPRRGERKKSSGCPPFEALFPPSDEEQRWMGLERCMRLLPHDHDGGGFFIAIIDKIGEHDASAGALSPDEPEVCVADGASVLPEALASFRPTTRAGDPPGTALRGALASRASELGPGETATAVVVAGTGSERGAHTRESTGADSATTAATQADVSDEVPFARPLHAVGGGTTPKKLAIASASGFAPLFELPSELCSQLATFYGLDGAFPFDRLLARSAQVQPPLVILIAPSVRSIIDADSNGQLRIVNTGVRIFEKSRVKGATCEYRVCNGALPFLLPHMQRQRARMRREVLEALLIKGELKSQEWKQHDDSAHHTLEDCAPGYVVLECEGKESQPIVVTALKAPSGNLQLMISKAELASILRRLGVSATDVTKAVATREQRQQAQREKALQQKGEL